MSEIETAVIATVLLLVCAACVFRLSRKSSDAPTNDLGQPLLGAHSADAHDTIRAHLAVSAAPPTNLRQWGMEDNSSSARVSTFRISSVTRATTMGGPPLAADRSFIPDEEAITFVNVRAIDYSNPVCDTNYGQLLRMVCSWFKSFGSRCSMLHSSSLTENALPNCR